MDLNKLANDTSSKIWEAWGDLVRMNAAIGEHDFAVLILPAFEELHKEFIDTLLEGEKRWSEAEKTVLKMLGKGMEYEVLYCNVEHAEDKLNELAKQRWEVIHANANNSSYHATLKRKKL